jgi:hypothetical protein
VVPIERTTRHYGKQQLPRDLNVYASLVLECENEGLSEAQLKAQNDAKLEFKQAHDKINEMIKNQTVRVQLKLKINLKPGFCFRYSSSRNRQWCCNRLHPI